MEMWPAFAFGFPLGERTRYGREQYPSSTGIPGKVTRFHGPTKRLDGIEFDGQINKGQSGGPLLDATGRVAGVEVATIEGKAMNLAIPVSRLRDFLASPGIAFHPPALAYRDRWRPVTWPIKLEPPKAGGTVPHGLSVRVTVAVSKEDRRTCEARKGAGRDLPGRGESVAERAVHAGPRDRGHGRGQEGHGGPGELLASDRAGGHRAAGCGQSRGRTGIRTPSARSRTTVFGPYNPRVPGIGGFGPEPGLGGLGPRVPGLGVPREEIIVVVPKNTPRCVAPNPVPTDTGLITVTGRLDVSGKPRGAGRSIRPPTLEIGKRVGPIPGGLRDAGGSTATSARSWISPSRPTAGGWCRPRTTAPSW